jgi:putative ABC transport system permease protein
MDDLARNVRHAWRELRRQPAFTALAVVTLALGIGAATTIFSVIQNVLLDPFPYHEAERVVAVQIRDAARADQSGRSMFQTPEFLDYRAQTGLFDDVIAGSFEEVLYSSREGTELLTSGLMSVNNFTFLGVAPLLGRTFAPDDAAGGAAPVFVMSHKMWRKHFGEDPAVLGRVFTLNGVATTLIGVMPPRFTKLNADIYQPVVLDRADPAVNERWFMFQAKLKRGVTRERAEAELGALATRLAKVYPRNYPPRFVLRVVSWVDNIIGPFRKTLYTLAAAVGLLLLIACTNVANMLLARASAREKEMAIRSALGAGRGRLVGQLLLESLLLALLGAALGCALAYAGIKALVQAMPDGMIPRESVIRLNLPVLAFSVGLAVLTAVVFGLVPALQVTGPALMEPLRDARKGAGAGSRRGGLRSALVVLEVALSLVLLAGAGLLMRSFVKLQSVELGFDPARVLAARLPLPRGQYQTAAAKQQFFEPLLARLGSLPGVVAVSAASTLPPYGGIRSEVDLPGRTHAERWESIFQLCSQRYFETLGMRLQRGRALSEADVLGARRVAVVNRTFVDRFLGAEEPLGRLVTFKRLGAPPAGSPGEAVFEIVGVVGDARNQGLQDPTLPEAFLPYTVTGAFDRGLLLRTAGEPLAVVNSLRREVWATDPNVAVTQTDSLENFLSQFSYARPRFTLIVLGVFAAVGLVLVAMGVYGVIAYGVARQTHEIGIRMALGASRGRVLGMVLGRGIRLVGAGVGLGLVASLALTRVLASQLWNVKPHDPFTLALVVAVLVAASGAACYFPARRATRVDPLVALRAD